MVNKKHNLNESANDNIEGAPAPELDQSEKAKGRSEWRKITKGLKCPTCASSNSKGPSGAYAYRIVYGKGIEWYCRVSPYWQARGYDFHTRTNNYTESRQYQQALREERLGLAESMPDQEFTKVEVIRLGEKDKTEVKDDCLIIRRQIGLPKWPYS